MLVRGAEAMAPGIEVSTTKICGEGHGGPSHHQPHPRGTDPFQFRLLAPSPLAFHGSPKMCDLALNEGPICAGAEHPVKRTVQSPVARSPSGLVSQTGCAKRSRDVRRPPLCFTFHFLTLHAFARRVREPIAFPDRDVSIPHAASTCLPGPWDRLLATWNCHSGTGCRRRLEVILEKQHRSSSTRFYHKSTSDANPLRVS